MAKESVVSTLELLFENNIATILTTFQALTLVTFASIYTTCGAAIAFINRELVISWATSVVVFQCVGHTLFPLHFVLLLVYFN